MKRLPQGSQIPWYPNGPDQDDFMDYTKSFGPNWAVTLLPYIEQDNLTVNPTQSAIPVSRSQSA